MADLPTFPQRLLCFSESWRIGNAARGGGPSFGGIEQFVVSPAARWEAKVSFHCVEDEDYIEADGFLASLDGSASGFYVPVYDWRGRPWNINPQNGGLITPRLANASYKVDPAYRTNPDTTGELSFSLAASASMNATSLQILRTKGGFVRRGQKFSINGRLHIIISVDTADPVDPSSGLPISGVIGVKVRPWLRQDYAAGTPLEFANPISAMRLTADSNAMLERTSSPLSDISLSLVEYLD